MNKQSFFSPPQEERISFNLSSRCVSIKPPPPPPRSNQASIDLVVNCRNPFHSFILNPNSDGDIKPKIPADFFPIGRSSFGNLDKGKQMAQAFALVEVFCNVHKVTNNKGSLDKNCVAIPMADTNEMHFTVPVTVNTAGSWQNKEANKRVTILGDDQIVELGPVLESLTVRFKRGLCVIAFLVCATMMCLTTNKLIPLLKLFEDKVGKDVVMKTFLVFLGISTLASEKTVDPEFLCFSVELFIVCLKLCLGGVNVDDPEVQEVLQKFRDVVIKNVFTVINRLVQLTREYRLNKEGNNIGRKCFKSFLTSKQFQGWIPGMFVC